MSITQQLDALADYQAQRDYLALKKQELIDSVITPEIHARLDEIEAEFAPQFQAVDANIASLELEIKAAVIEAGASVKGEHLQAVFSKGRVSWDAKACDAYSVAHPEILAFRKEGDPSVSIRKI